MRNAWDLLTKPPATVREPDRRRQSQLLASLLVALIVIGVAVIAHSIILHTPEMADAQDKIFSVTTLASVFVLMVAYGLNRSGRYTLAALLTVGTTSIAVILTSLPVYSPEDLNWISYLVIPILIGSLLLSSRMMVAVAVANALGVLLLSALIPGDILASLILDHLTFIVLVVVMVLFTTYHRNQLKKDQQAELVAREERLRIVVQNMPVMMDAFDANENIIIWNRECERVTGFGAAEIVGNPKALELLLPDRAYREYMLAEWTASSDDRRDWEWEMTCKDGSLRSVAWANVSARLPIPGWASWGIGVDVTERKRVEARMRRRLAVEEALENIVRLFVSPARIDLNHILSILGEATGADRAALFLFRDDHARMDNTLEWCAPGAAPHILSLQDLDTSLFKWWMAQFQSGETIVIANVDALPAAANAERSFLRARRIRALLAAPILATDGSLLGFIEFDETKRPRAWLDEDAHALRVVSEMISIYFARKGIEDALRASEQRYRLLFERNLAGVYRATLDGKLLDCNDSFARILGYASRDEAMARYAAESAFDIVDRAAMVAQLRDQGALTNFELPLRRRDGAIGWVLENVSLVKGSSDGLAFLQGTLVDITERKRAEAALEEERALLARRVEERTADLSAANAELAKAARLKDEFLASMSHELRTPLNAILGLSEALQEQVYGPLNEEQLQSLHTIEESGRHLLSLINDILDLSKIEAGKAELNITPVAVEAVCRASLQFVKQTAHKKRITVSAAIDEQLSTIQADERRLKQILVNLLSNAVKFTPEDGSIGLEVTGDAERDVARFTVWDTGIGIAPQDMPRLFQPFVQLDSSLARQHAGTGLGLVLTYRMVEQHGGSISVDSEPGRGSRFAVHLPWSPCSDAPEPDVQAGASTPRDVRPHIRADRLPLVLLAEDSSINVRIIADYLQAKDYRLIVARSGREAIERALEERPDIILMDVQMPGMDGLEATRRIRADASLAGVPIIALTALAMPGDRERTIQAGANDYMSKPVSLKQLAGAIEACLN
jgi:PAS domain S-box-containing protein